MKRKIAILNAVWLLTFFLMIVPQHLWAQREQNATYWLEMALTENNVNRKIEYYIRALEINPSDSETHNNLGILYKSKGFYIEAVAEYQTALNNPSYRTPEYAHHNLGVVYKEMEEYEKAIEHFKASIEINSQFAKAYNGIGLAYKGIGEFEKATDNFRQALKIKPDYIQAEYNLQNVWKLPSKEKALDQKAAKLYNQGVVLAKQGKYTQAIAAIQEALRLKPGQMKVAKKLEALKRRQDFMKWHKTALVQMNAGKWSKAHEYLEKALKVAANETEVKQITKIQEQISSRLNKEKKELRVAWLYKQGLVKIKNKDWLGAISDFTKLLILVPDHSQAKEKNRQARVGYYYEEALNSINQGKWKPAKEQLDNLLTLQPEHVDAKREMEKVRKHLHSRNIEYALERGAQAFNLGEWGAAQRFYEEVLRLSPDNQVAKNKLTRIEQTTDKKGRSFGDKPTPWENWVKPVLIIGFLLTVLSVYYLVVRIFRATHFLNYYHQFKDSDESRILYERMLQADPHRRPIYSLLAETYYELDQVGNVDALLQRCEEYSQQTPGNEAAFWAACSGEIYQSIHQLEKATQQMEQALSMQPNQEKIKDKLKQLYQTMLREQDNPEITNRLTQLQLSVLSKPKQDLTVEEQQQDRLDLLKECFGRDKN